MFFFFLNLFMWVRGKIKVHPAGLVDFYILPAVRQTNDKERGVWERGISAVGKRKGLDKKSHTSESITRREVGSVCECSSCVSTDVGVRSLPLSGKCEFCYCRDLSV